MQNGTRPAQISEENKTENLVGQATPTSESIQPEPTPTPTENQNSEISSAPVSPQGPTADAAIPPTESAPAEVVPMAPKAPLSPESATPVKDDIPANEPLNQSSIPEIIVDPVNPNITIEKHGNDVTITEVMEPTAHSEPATAQMAGNEPLGIRKRCLCHFSCIGRLKR